MHFLHVQLQMISAFELLLTVYALNLTREVMQGHVLRQVHVIFEHRLADGALMSLAEIRMYFAFVKARVLVCFEHLTTVLTRRGARRVVQCEVFAQN